VTEASDPHGSTGSTDPEADTPALEALGLDALENYADLGAPEFDLADVARTSGLDIGALEAFWRALGFPEARAGEKQLTAADVDMLSTVVSRIADGTLDPDAALQMARVIGSALDRVAAAQVDALVSRLTRPAVGTEREELRRTLDLAGLMPPVLEFVWRRQLAAAARRRLLRAAAPGESPPACVGFADLVGFTAQTQQLDQSELALVVGRFEAIAYDVVARHGGRVVKTIGDEVMFLTDDADVAARIALDLARTYRDDPDLSDVRVGLALGPVLERDGDIYGHTVNLANRIVSVAYPGSVVVSGELYDALEQHDDYEFTSLRNHYLKDIGRVPLWRLRRTGEEVDGPYRAARRSRSSRSRILEERWRERDRQLRLRGAGALTAAVAGRIEDLPDRVAHVLSGSAPPEVVQELVDDPTPEELSALADLVLDAGLDPDLEIELLTDIGAAPDLRLLDLEANRRATEAEDDAERRLKDIEDATARRIAQVEREAQQKVADVIARAEADSRKVDLDAAKRMEKVVDEAHRKAEKATKEARQRAAEAARRKS
jgi:adenylate cyclase